MSSDMVNALQGRGTSGPVESGSLGHEAITGARFPPSTQGRVAASLAKTYFLIHLELSTHELVLGSSSCGVSGRGRACFSQRQNRGAA
jgi:hypothetical protein